MTSTFARTATGPSATTSAHSLSTEMPTSPNDDARRAERDRLIEYQAHANDAYDQALFKLSGGALGLSFRLRAPVRRRGTGCAHALCIGARMAPVGRKPHVRPRVVLRRRSGLWTRRSVSSTRRAPL